MTSGPGAAKSPSSLPELSVLDVELAIHRFERHAQIPKTALDSSFFSITKTADELSIVCEAGRDLGSTQSETGWRAIKLEGPLEFSLIGILARVTRVLAAVSISIFAISTFNTDYILVKEKHLLKAKQVLMANGYTFISRK